MTELVERDPHSSVGPTFQLLRGDFRQVDVPRADAVYADPPYFGREDLYKCDRIPMADLVALMEATAPARAMSMSQGMLWEVKDLVSGPVRVCPWLKPWSPIVANPAVSWEPVILWGQRPTDRGPGIPVPRDSLTLKAGGDNPSLFPTPKPDGFCSWVMDLLGVGIRPGGLLVDLFSGSGAMSRAAIDRGWDAVGVDAMTVEGVWTGDPLAPVHLMKTGAGPRRIRQGPTQSRELEGPVDPGDPHFCPLALKGYPEWPFWYTNRHQMKPVHFRGYITRVERPRMTVEGVKACSECHQILKTDGSEVPASKVADGERVFIRRTASIGKRRRVFLREHPITEDEVRGTLATSGAGPARLL